MSDFIVDYTKNSKYNPDTSIQDVRWGAGGPVTEMDLNEAQKIQTTQRRKMIKSLFGDGFLKSDGITFENGVLKITDTKAILDGYIIEIDSISFTPTEGKTVYLNAWLEEVTGKGTLYKYGNVQGEVIDNYILDSRFNGVEITRRNQLLYNLLDDNFKSELKLEIGTLNNGEFAFNYPMSSANDSSANTPLDIKTGTTEIQSSRSNDNLISLDDVKANTIQDKYRVAVVENSDDGLATIDYSKVSGDRCTNIRLFGKSTQDGNPTPDNPIEISNLGTKISYHAHEYMQGAIDKTTGEVSESENSIRTKEMYLLDTDVLNGMDTCKLGVSCSTKVQNIYVFFYDSTDTFISAVGKDATDDEPYIREFTCVIPSNAAKCHIQLGKSETVSLSDFGYINVVAGTDFGTNDILSDYYADCSIQMSKQFKNKFQIGSIDTDKFGITYSHNDISGVIHLNGTSTDINDVGYDIVSVNEIVRGDYILTVDGSTSDIIKTEAYVKTSDGTEKIGNVNNGTLNFTLSDTSQVIVKVIVSNGITVDSDIKIMVRNSSVQDATYEPYISDGNIIEHIYLNNPLMSSKDLKTRDEFTRRSGEYGVIRRIKTETITTVANKSAMSGTNGVFLAELSENPIVSSGDSGRGSCLSNKFSDANRQIAYSDLPNYENTITTYIDPNTNKSYVAFTFDSTITTVEEAQAKIGDGFEIQYELQIPTFDVLSGCFDETFLSKYIQEKTYTEYFKKVNGDLNFSMEYIKLVDVIADDSDIVAPHYNYPATIIGLGQHRLNQNYIQFNDVDGVISTQDKSYSVSLEYNDSFLLGDIQIESKKVLKIADGLKVPNGRYIFDSGLFRQIDTVNFFLVVRKGSNKTHYYSVSTNLEFDLCLLPSEVLDIFLYIGEGTYDISQILSPKLKLVGSDSSEVKPYDSNYYYALKSSGSNKTPIYSDNLLDYNAWKNSDVSGYEDWKAKYATVVYENNGVTITATNNDGFTRRTKVIEVSVGETYELSWECDTTTEGRIIIFAYDSEMNFLPRAMSIVNNFATKKIVYTIHDGVAYINFRFGVVNNGDTISYKNIQLRKVKNSYENEIKIPLSEPLYGIGGTKDVICKRNGYYGVLRFFTRIILNANKNWRLVEDNTKKRRYDTYTSEHTDSKLLCGRICDTLNCKNSDIHEFGAFYATNEFIVINDNNNRFVSVDDLKNNFLANGIEIIAELKEPIFEQFSDDVQLAIRQFKSYSDGTIVCTDDISKSEFTISFLSDADSENQVQFVNMYSRMNLTDESLLDLNELINEIVNGTQTVGKAKDSEKLGGKLPSDYVFADKESRFNFTNENLNGVNIDEVWNYNYVVSISADGFGTRPLNEYVTVINFYGVHFIAQIAITCNTSNKMYIRNKYLENAWKPWTEILSRDISNPIVVSSTEPADKTAVWIQ